METRLGKLLSLVLIGILISTKGFSQLDLNWATKIQCSQGGYDYTTAIHGDGNNNMIAVGNFEGTVDLDPGTGKYFVNSRGDYDMFLVKYDSLGSLIWAKTIGGVAPDEASDMIVDSLGNIYLTGFCSASMDFEGSGDTTYLKPIGSANTSVIFLAKYDSNGNFIWAKMMGGTGFGFGKRMQFDLNGDIILVGNFKVTVDFDPSVNVLNYSATGSNYYDIFLSKFSPNGDLIWANRIGGGDYDEVNGMIVDSLGNFLITGYMNQTVDFDPGAGTMNLTTPVNNSCGFIAKYDNNCGLVWAVKHNKECFDLVIDAFGKLRVSTTKTIISGEVASLSRLSQAGVVIDAITFSSSGCTKVLRLAPDSSLYMGGPQLNLSINTYQEINVRKINTNGAIVFEKKFGSSTKDDELTCLYVDSKSRLFIGGYYQNAIDFDQSSNTAARASNRLFSAFTAAYQSNGDFIYASVVTDDINGANSTVNSQLTDINGRLIVAGYYAGVIGFNTVGTNEFFLNQGNFNNGFLCRYKTNSQVDFAMTLRGNESHIQDVALDKNQNIYIAGYFLNKVDFDPSQDTVELNAPGANGEEIFLAKYDSAGNFLWVKQFGSTGDDRGLQLYIRNNRLFLIGSFEGTVDFNPSASTNNLVATGTDYFLAAYDLDGNYLLAHKSEQPINSIEMDVAGNIFLSGGYPYAGAHDLDFGPGTYYLPSYAYSSGYLAKYDSLLTIQWAVLTGASSKCLIDTAGNSYLSGATSGQAVTRYYSANSTYTSTTFPNLGNSQQYCLAKYNSNGMLTWVKNTFFTGGTMAFGFALDKKSNVYISGTLSDTVDFDLTNGTNTIIPFSVTNPDAYIASYSNNGDLNWVKTNPTFGNEVGGLLTLADDKLYTRFSSNYGLDIDFTGATYDIGNGTYMAQYDLSCLSVPQIVSVIPDSICNSGSAQLSVITNAGGQANWYNTATSSTVLYSGNTFTTSNLTSTKTYYVAIPNGACSVARIPVTALVTPYPVVSNLWNHVRCTPGTLTLTATTTAGTINWYDSAVGGNLLATGNSYTTPSLSTSTTYYLDATSNGCTSQTRSPKLAVISKIPTIQAQTAVSGCSGNQIQLTASVDTGNIQWQTSNGTWLWSGSPYYVTTSTNMTVYVKGYIGSCESLPIAVNITLTALPTISSTVPASNCGAGTVQLNATPNPSNATITWYDASVSGNPVGTGNSLTTPFISNNTTYYAQVSSPNCINYSRSAVLATIKPTPSLAVNVSQNTMTAQQSGASYSWLNCSNNQLIPGATGQSYTASSNGSYAVHINLNGCSDTSNCVVITGEENLQVEDDVYTMYPNPASELIQITQQNASQLKVTIYDAQGKLVLTKESKERKFSMDIAQLATGLYLVEFSHETTVMRSRLIKK